MPKQRSQSGAGIQPLRIARELRGLTQRQLGQKASFTQAQISRLEAGGRQPRLTTVRRLADALDVQVDSLFPRDGGAELRVALTEYFQGRER